MEPTTNKKIFKELAILAAIVVVFMVVFNLAMNGIKEKRSKDRAVSEISNVDYIFADMYFKNHPAGKDMYYEFLKDSKMTKEEYSKIRTAVDEYENKVRGKEIEKIKMEGSQRNE